MLGLAFLELLQNWQLNGPTYTADIICTPLFYSQIGHLQLGARLSHNYNSNVLYVNPHFTLHWPFGIRPQTLTVCSITAAHQNIISSFYMICKRQHYALCKQIISPAFCCSCWDFIECVLYGRLAAYGSVSVRACRSFVEPTFWHAIMVSRRITFKSAAITSAGRQYSCYTDDWQILYSSFCTFISKVSSTCLQYDL